MDVVFAIGLLLSFAIGAALSAWLQGRRVKKLEQDYKVQLQNTISQMEQAHEARLRENIQSLQAQYQRLKPTIGQPSRVVGAGQFADSDRALLKNEPAVSRPDSSLVKEKAAPTEPLVRTSTIAAALSSPPLTQHNARSPDRKIYVWGESGQLRYIPQLLRYAKHPDKNVRGLVAEALGKIARTSSTAVLTPQAISILANLSCDRSLQVRQKAIVALGTMRSEKVIPILERALHDPSSSIVKVAGAALGKLKYYRTVKPTKPITKQPPSKAPKAPFGRPRYYRIDDQPPLSQLLAPPKQELLPENLSDRLRAWGKSHQIKYISQLVKYVNHPDRGVRGLVANALGEIAASHSKRSEIQGVVIALDRLSGDCSLEVRQHAVAALGKIQSEKVIPLLTKISHAPFGSLAKSASAALGRLKYYPVVVPGQPTTATAKTDLSKAIKSRPIKRPT